LTTAAQTATVADSSLVDCFVFRLFGFGLEELRAQKPLKTTSLTSILIILQYNAMTSVGITLYEQ
jgi:hypothetical protein